jgi:hypothetical protein
MRRLIIVFITILVALNMPSCAALKVKTRPAYKDVDPRAQSYVNEYMDLSKQNHLEFKHKVTLGFKHIKQGDTIGLCTWGGYFREIDLDIDYWNNASKIGRLALVYHELTHCYCGREHDYGKGKKYPEKAVERARAAIDWFLTGGPKPGYWDDGCPTSIMHPVIVEDNCMKTHYNEYVTEMFDRCKPY